MLTDFTAFDLETTGLEDTAEIIEFGAVRIRNGEVVERFSELVAPEGKVSPEISRLTGISNKMLRGAPALKELLPRFIEFLGSDTLVAHNVNFDLGFTRRWAAKLGLEFENRPCWDTVQLSQLLLPTLANHRLGTVARRLQVPLVSAHRACDDAEATANVLLSLRQIGLKLPEASLQDLLALAAGTSSRQEHWLQALAADAGRTPCDTVIACAAIPASDCQENVYRRDALPQAVRHEDLDQWFGSEGQLSQAIEGFQHRPQQLKMAQAVAAGFKQGLFQAIEAATGTGKSFAYLLPAVIQGRNSVTQGERGVVISTNTRNLQEQLFHKDIPLLGSVLNGALKAVLLKGRHNYICGRRWQQLLREARQRLSDEERLKLMPIVLWLATTRSGDIEECTAFHWSANRQLWSLLRSDSRHCAGSACRNGDQCWLNRIRKQSLDAHLVVVNHSLLLSDLGVDGAILGEYRHLILDEAHNLSRTAERQLRKEFSFADTMRVCRALYDPQHQGRGLLRQIRQQVIDPAGVDSRRQRVVRGLEECAEVLSEMHDALNELWTLFNARQREQYGETIANQRYTMKRRFEQAQNPLLHFVAQFQRLGATVPDLKKVLDPALAALEDFEEHQEGEQQISSELKAQTQVIFEAFEELDALMDHGDADVVAWFEIHPGTLETRFYRCPLKIGATLAEELYSRLDSLLLTSATLAVDGDFDYLMKSTGLSRLDRSVSCLTLETPFNFERQVRVLVPQWLPEPSSRNRMDFCRKLADLIADLSQRHGRGTLLLFTSYSFLNTTLQALMERVDYRKIPLLAQGKDGTRSDLLRAFKQAGNAILLGTDSFWEGVDVPGEALQLLVMTKLPFDVPNEPMVEARSRALEAAGMNAFMEYSVPEAVIRFRQGFGRLIRHEGDRGIFLLLDQRAVTKRYGEKFTGSLPVGAKSFFRGEDLLKTIDNFWSK